MEEIKKDDKVIAVVGSEKESFWKNQVENTKARLQNLKDELQFWEVVLKAAEKEFTKARRDHS